MKIEQLLGDVRVSIRSLRRSPGFSTVVVATLSIGIAAVTALFSAVYSYQYRPLPYVDSDRIIAISERSNKRGFPTNFVSSDAAIAIREGSRSFEGVSIFRSGYGGYYVGSRATYATTLWIDSSFAPLLSLHPQLGRSLMPDDIRSRAPNVVISDAFWRSSFGSDPNVLGKTIRLGDTLLTVVGVMPKGFRYPQRTDVWRPLSPSDSSAGAVTLLGKLKSSVSTDQLNGELSVIAQRLARSDSEQFSTVSFISGEMVDRHSGPAALRIAFLFVGAAAFVLLIACGNVVNLFLVRAAERRGEMAVRSSLGASRLRLLVHGLIEASLLSSLAAAIGTILSAAILKFILPTIIPMEALPSWVHFSIDGRILAFTVLVSVLVSLAVGTSAALDGSRPDLMRVLKAGGDRTLSRGGVGKRARTGIVVQLTFSVVLLAGALLFARSYSRVAKVDLGFPGTRILQVRWYYGEQGDTAQRFFAKELLRRVQSLPGVTQAAIRDAVGPYSFVERPKSTRRGVIEKIDTRLFVDGQLATPRTSAKAGGTRIRETAVSVDYFNTLGLRVVSGRPILASDVAGQEKVVVVSRQFARMFWGQENPIGHTIKYGAYGELLRVVGVVEDVRDVTSGRDGISASAVPDMYFSEEQVGGQRSILLRGDGDVNAFRIPVERMIRELDPMKETRFATMNESVEQIQFQSEVFGGLLASFAVSGLVLSLIGIYGIVAYGITERTREIGIRLALGGTSGDVLQMIVRSSLQFIVIGLAIGLALSQGTNRLLVKLVYDVSPADPLTYAIVCVVFAGVGLLSAYLPARRVSRVDPVIALRAE